MHDLGRERIMVSVRYVIDPNWLDTDAGTARQSTDMSHVCLFMFDFYLFLDIDLSAAIMIEAIYELTRAKMKETEIDGVPRTKNQVCYHL